ncbi:unnamed protein product, partial [Meganyctiphanes norvegica]
VVSGLHSDSWVLILEHRNEHLRTSYKRTSKTSDNMPGHVKKTEGPDPDPSQWLFITREMRLKDMAKPYDAKEDCWVVDEKEGFALGKIVGTKGNMVTVEVRGTKKDFKADAVKQVNPPKYEKAEDMSNLTFLNDPSVYYNLKTRYQAE